MFFKYFIFLKSPCPRLKPGIIGKNALVLPRYSGLSVMLRQNLSLMIELFIINNEKAFHCSNFLTTLTCITDEELTDRVSNMFVCI